ncbi:MAG: hypothetical protein QXH10_09355 [Ignisphaera sp.]
MAVHRLSHSFVSSPPAVHFSTVSSEPLTAEAPLRLPAVQHPTVLGTPRAPLTMQVLKLKNLTNYTNNPNEHQKENSSSYGALYRVSPWTLITPRPLRFLSLRL